MAEEEKPEEKDQETTDPSEAKTEDTPDANAAKSDASAEGDPSASDQSDAAVSAKKKKRKIKKKKVKKRKKKKRPSIKTYLRSFWMWVKENFGGMREGLAQPDIRTRKISRLFFVSFFLAVVALIGAVTVIVKKYSQPTTVVAKVDGDEKSLEDAEPKGPGPRLDLGSFNIEVKKIDGGRGMLNIAEVGVVVECDQTSTCDYLKEHMDRTRDRITSIFQVLEQREVLSPEGKRWLKQKIQDQINSFLKSGKIEQVYFVKLVVG